MNKQKGLTLPAWFTAFLSRYKREVALALVLGVLASGCAALLMFTSGYLISATAGNLATLFAVMVPIACVQLFGFGRPFARYAERLISHDWVLRMTSDLNLALFWGIERRTGDPARERAAGEYLGLLSDDVAHLQNLYLRVVFPTVIAIALAIATSLVFGFFSIPFALVMLLILALCVLALPRCSLLLVRALEFEGAGLRAEEYAHLTDDILGSADWIYSGRSAAVRADHTAQDIRLRSIYSSIRLRQRVLSLASTLIMGLGILLILVWSSMRFTGSAAGSAEAANWIAAFVLGFFPLIEAFAMLPALTGDSLAHRRSIVRLDEYMDSYGIEGTDLSGDPSLDLDSKDHISKDSPLKITGISAYALHSINLEIPAGSNVAILGKSGAGKTTLANVIRGYIAPDQGNISIGEMVLASGAVHSEYVGYLSQQPYLFNRTLRANLTLGTNVVSDEVLIDILDSVGLHQRFSQLDQGLDTIIGETGEGFSGGEAHRIALARVLVRNTPIVIVDEPFSALDPETETMLLDTLFDTCKDRTLIVITHHLTGIERFDRVIFIEDGEVALDGSPSELEATSPRFQTLLAFDKS